MLAFYRPVERPLARCGGLGWSRRPFDGLPRHALADRRPAGSRLHAGARDRSSDRRALPEIITFWQAIGSWRARPWAGKPITRAQQKPAVAAPFLWRKGDNNGPMLRRRFCSVLNEIEASERRRPSTRRVRHFPG